MTAMLAETRQDRQGDAYLPDMTGFASATEDLPRPLFDLLVVEGARANCAAFLERFGGELASRSCGLGRMIESWCEAGGTSTDAWSYGAGRLRAALRTGNGGDPVMAAAQFAAQILAGGIPGRFEATTGQPWQLWFDGLRFDCGAHVSIESDGQRAVLETDRNAAPLHFEMQDGQWRADGQAPLARIPIADGAIRLLPSWSIDCTSFADVHPRLASDRRYQSGVGELRSAVDYLERHVPDHARWAARVITGVIPLKRPPSRQYLSGSYIDRPGIMTCSFPGSPAMIGELLVHEAAHFHLYVASRLGALHDQADERLYYSPARQMDRPLFYILLAFHASANMLLYHRHALAAGAGEGDVHRARAAVLEDWTEQLGRPLRRSGALTALGQDLYRPLAALP
ncbi:MAG: aKG-HExxH-type peptide beta-hydroxylase [Sphingobium sp.]